MVIARGAGFSTSKEHPGRPSKQKNEETAVNAVYKRSESKELQMRTHENVMRIIDEERLDRD